MSTKKTCVALCAVLAFAVSACGNQPDRGSVFKAVKQGTLKTKATTPSLPSAEELKRTISEALSNTDKRLAIAVVENRNSFTFLTEIAENGAYSTWGSPDRRTITEKQGMISATRGLGADLMSANLDESLALVQARRAGTVSRSHVYLDGENAEVTLHLSCTIDATGNQNLAIGEIKTSTTTVRERCKGGGQAFENTYQVAPTGRIVQSRQWLGPQNGYFTVQKLR